MPEGQAGIRTFTRPDPTSVSVRLAVEADLDGIAVLFAPGLEPYRGRVGDWILDAYLRDLVDVRGRFDHRNINLDVPEFSDGKLIPTGENLARFIFVTVAEALQTAGARAKVTQVTVAEDATLSTTYRGD